MRFYDEVRVFVRSGAGGNGCVSFRREKYVPRGGPDGGDGGRGGDVVFVADAHRHNLIDLAYQKHYRAERGEHGMGKQRYGRGGRDLLVHVPVGTLVFDEQTGDRLAELVRADERWTAAKGGKGGLGNMHFASSTNRAPRQMTPGEPSQERWLRVELKLMADVGMLGFPNAGKSTLVGAISRARPKIANYPFTTLVPQLGTVESEEAGRLVVADIPGIIEGASEGAGLGLRFLRHIERNHLLIHLLDLSPETGRDPAEDFAKLNAELRAYGRDLIEKPQIVAANKIDVEGAEKRLEALRRALPEEIPVFAISAMTGQGVGELLAAVRLRLERMEVLRPEESNPEPPEPADEPSEGD